MTMGSLFDGIGGFPLAASRHGIKTLWASEIEAFPMAVTKLHFPHMIHVGDIRKCQAQKEARMANQIQPSDGGVIDYEQYPVVPLCGISQSAGRSSLLAGTTR